METEWGGVEMKIGRGVEGGGRKMYTVNQHLFAMTLFCNLLAINWFATTNFHI